MPYYPYRIPQTREIGLNMGSTTLTSAPAALQEITNTAIRRDKCDLTGMAQVRLVARVSTVGVAGCELRAQYSTDESSWVYLDGSTGPAISLATPTGTKASAWATLPDAAKADVFLRLVTINGDGAASPVIGNAGIQVQ